MEALQGLLVEVAVLLAVAMLTWVANSLRAYIKSKSDKDMVFILDKLVDTAVWAVEQRGSGPFASKKDAARQTILDQLRDMKMDRRFSIQTIDAAIEAAVGANFHYGKHTGESVEGGTPL